MFSIILAKISLPLQTMSFSIYLPLAMDLLSDVKITILNEYNMAASVPVSLQIQTVLFPLRWTGLFPVIQGAKIALGSSMDL